MAAPSPSRSRGIPAYPTPPPNSAAIGRLPEAATASTGQRLTKTSAPKGCCAERPLRVVARAVEDSQLPRATSADKGGAPGERNLSGAPVIFQEVVHSVGTGEAGCDEQLVTLETEWTITRMPHGRSEQPRSRRQS